MTIFFWVCVIAWLIPGYILISQKQDGHATEKKLDCLINTPAGLLWRFIALPALIIYHIGRLSFNGTDWFINMVRESEFWHKELW